MRRYRFASTSTADARQRHAHPATDPGRISFVSSGDADPSTGQPRLLSAIERLARLLGWSRTKSTGEPVRGVARHSLRNFASDQHAARLCLAPNGPVHRLAAERMKEADRLTIAARFGKRIERILQ